MATEENIKQIVNKIVKEFNPERVILFGSYAWGKPHPDSDVDLLIVKTDPQKNTREMAIELEKLLSKRDFPLDLLVYKPDELQEKINQERNLFLEDIVRNGKMLYSTPGSANIPLRYNRPLVIVP